MGAKQSKRSVDISGKEAESAGEVAAAGAGGEGRVEQLADADSLKPQLNGDAHIHEQQTDKEKQLDVETPENEKDATTEKESKPEEDTEAGPVTNGDSEPNVENGESTPPPEDAKKPKKEKVKKKWSLRSISFSRKDKPKQEKKQKDDEQKTNGEPEKVPEEAGDVPAVAVVTEAAENGQALTEVKEEKTPETPVTEPITNGSSAAESAGEESPAAEAAGPCPAPEPEHLPVNGLSLEEPKLEIPQVEVNVQIQPEEPIAVKAENAPAPDISVIKEVCVEQMPLIEPTPPPLPANPPPSSVASFAATTMAPELADASLSNTAENSVSALPNISETKDTVAETTPEPQITLTDTQTVSSELHPPEQETLIETPVNVPEIVAELTNTDVIQEPILEQSIQEVEVPKVEIDTNEIDVEMKEVPETTADVPTLSEPEVTTEPITDVTQDIEALPPPPPSLVEDINNAVEDNVDAVGKEVELTISKEIMNNANHISENETLNGFEKDLVVDNVNTEHENVKNKTKDSLGNVMDTIECNGNVDDPKMITEPEITEKALTEQCPENADVDSGKVASVEEPLPPPPSGAERAASAEPAPAATPQEPVAVCDKLADLIPDIPCVPELNTETLQETTSDVAVAD